MRMTARNQQPDAHLNLLIATEPDAIQSSLTRAKVQPCGKRTRGAGRDAARLEPALTYAQIKIGPRRQYILIPIPRMRRECLQGKTMIEVRRTVPADFLLRRNQLRRSQVGAQDQ